MDGGPDRQGTENRVACLLQVTGRSGALLGTFGAFERIAKIPMQNGVLALFHGGEGWWALLDSNQ